MKKKWKPCLLFDRANGLRFVTSGLGEMATRFWMPKGTVWILDPATGGRERYPSSEFLFRLDFT